jgi:hypothetical protein
MLDLSFPPLTPDTAQPLQPETEVVEVLRAGAAGEGDATRRIQALLDHPAPAGTPFAPNGGSFNAAVAAAFARWKGQ